MISELTILLLYFPLLTLTRHGLQIRAITFVLYPRHLVFVFSTHSFGKIQNFFGLKANARLPSSDHSDTSKKTTLNLHLK